MLLKSIKSALKRLPYRRATLDRSVSVGMAAHGNAAMTRAALEHLFSSIEGDFELILVDDASPDDTLEAFLEARKVHGNTRIFSFSENLEYCESVNAILSHAGGQYVFFISNDILVTPTYFQELIACLRDDTSCGIARGCSNFVDGHLQPHNLLNPNYAFADKTELFRFSAALSKVNCNRVPVDDPYLTGDAFAVSRRAIDRIGGFDTRFIGYIGDSEYAIRCRSAGLRSVVTARAFAYHNNGANLEYLGPEEKARKLERRFQCMRAAYQQLLRKYSIDDVGVPDALGPLNGDEFLHAMSRAGEQAQRDAQSRHVPLKDYSRYLVA